MSESSGTVTGLGLIVMASSLVDVADIQDDDGRSVLA
jgi:hypothetical protein